eukprot:gb/GECG01006204.1/.p1 GENE.gb/GECG01006204.1/~~gb/GECG01006204.1/.p1  ORF type:complete len:1504 (+),score=125.69 gb/GECG01006204.1/:1-4512(+)
MSTMEESGRNSRQRGSEHSNEEEHDKRFCRICREEEEDISESVDEAETGSRRPRSLSAGGTGESSTETSDPDFEAVESGLVRDRKTGMLKLAHDSLNPEEIFNDRLRAPCKCGGSVKHVHQSCLEEWLAISGREQCDLCHSQFHFEPVFLHSAPRRLPLAQWLAGAYLYFRKVRGFILRLILVFLHWGLWYPYACSLAYRTWIHFGSLYPSNFYERLYLKAMVIDWLCGLLLGTVTIIVCLVGSSLADFIQRELLAREHDAQNNNVGNDGRNARMDVQNRAVHEEEGGEQAAEDHAPPPVEHPLDERQGGIEEQLDAPLLPEDVEADLDAGDAIRITEVLGIRGSIATALLYAGAINFLTLTAMGAVFGIPVYLCRSLILSVSKQSVVPLIWSMEAIDWDDEHHTGDTPAIAWEDLFHLILGYISCWMTLVWLFFSSKIFRILFSRWFVLERNISRFVEGGLMVAKISGLLCLTMVVEPTIVGLNVFLCRSWYARESFFRLVSLSFFNPIQAGALFWAMGMLVVFVVITVLLLLRDSLRYEILARYILPFNPQDSLWKRLLTRPCWKQIISVVRTSLVSVFATAVVLHGVPFTAHTLSQYHPLGVGPVLSQWSGTATSSSEQYWIANSVELFREVTGFSEHTHVRLDIGSRHCERNDNNLFVLLSNALELPWLEYWWHSCFAPPRHRDALRRNNSASLKTSEGASLLGSLSLVNEKSLLEVNRTKIARSSSEMVVSLSSLYDGENTTPLPRLVTEWHIGTESPTPVVGSYLDTANDDDAGRLGSSLSGCFPSDTRVSGPTDTIAVVELWLRNVSNHVGVFHSANASTLSMCIPGIVANASSSVTMSGKVLARLPPLSENRVIERGTEAYNVDGSINSLVQVFAFSSRMSEISSHGTLFSIIGIAVVYMAAAIMMEGLRTVVWWSMTLWIEKISRLVALENHLLMTPDKVVVRIPDSSNSYSTGEIEFYSHRIPEARPLTATLEVSWSTAQAFSDKYKLDWNNDITQEYCSEAMKYELLQNAAEALSCVVYGSNSHHRNRFRIVEVPPGQSRRQRDWDNIGEEVNPGMVAFAQAHFARFSIDQEDQETESTDVTLVTVYEDTHGTLPLQRDTIAVSRLPPDDATANACCKIPGILYRFLFAYPFIMIFGLSSCVASYHLVVYVSCYLGSIVNGFFLGHRGVLQTAGEFAVGFALLIGLLNVLLLIYLSSLHWISASLRSESRLFLGVLNKLPKTLSKAILRFLFRLWKKAIRGSFHFDLIGDIPRRRSVISFFQLIALAALELVVMPLLFGFTAFLITDPLLFSQTLKEDVVSESPVELLGLLLQLWSPAFFGKILVVGYAVRLFLGEIANTGILGEVLWKTMEKASIRYLRVQCDTLWSRAYKPAIQLLLCLIAGLISCVLSVRLYYERYSTRATTACIHAWLDSWNDLQGVANLHLTQGATSPCEQEAELSWSIWWYRLIMVTQVALISLPLYFDRLKPVMRVMHDVLYRERYRVTRRLLDA